MISEISSSLGFAPEQRTVQKRHEPRYPIKLEVRSNPSFVGRDAELDKIHECLFAKPDSSTFDTACCVVHGLGGQGKTQTALAYYWKYMKEYDAAFWLESSTAADVKISYVKIAKKMQQANFLDHISPTDELSAEVERAREWLEGTSESLSR